MLDGLVFFSLAKLMDMDSRPVIYGAIFGIYRFIMGMVSIYSQIDIVPSEHVLGVVIMGFVSFGLATGFLILRERFDGILGYILIIVFAVLMYLLFA